MKTTRVIEEHQSGAEMAGLVSPIINSKGLTKAIRLVIAGVASPIVALDAIIGRLSQAGANRGR
jgi:hypothetical protein